MNADQPYQDHTALGKVSWIGVELALSSKSDSNCVISSLVFTIVSKTGMKKYVWTLFSDMLAFEMLQIATCAINQSCQWKKVRVRLTVDLILIDLKNSEISWSQTQFEAISSYSSYWPASVYRWYAHIRAVLIHTLHRGQRDTILCPLLVNYATLYFSLLLSQSRILSFFPPSLLSSLLFCHRCCRLQCLYWVNSCLFRSSHPNSHPRIPLWPHT